MPTLVHNVVRRVAPVKRDPRVTQYARKLDAALSTGNVMLHRGLVARKEDVDRLRALVLKIRF